MSSDTRSKIKDAYSKSGAEYDQVRLENPRGQILSDHDVRIFRRMYPRDAVGLDTFEIGAGTGRFTIPALEMGVSLYAADINQTMLDELKAKVDSMGVTDRCRIQTEDIFNLTPEDNTYDFVFSFHVIPRFLTMDDQASAIREVCRVIKPGGRFFFNYRNRKSFYNLLYKGPAATPRQIEQVLAEANMRVIEKRGKWLLNRKLVNKLPVFMGKLIAMADRVLEKFWPDRAWDVFVIAKKD